MTAGQFRDKQQREKLAAKQAGYWRLICNSPARFHVRRGNVVGNALTLQQFGQGRLR